MNRYGTLIQTIVTTKDSNFIYTELILPFIDTGITIINTMTIDIEIMGG